jgi:hypothetical protein
MPSESSWTAASSNKVAQLYVNYLSLTFCHLRYWAVRARREEDEGLVTLHFFYTLAFELLGNFCIFCSAPVLNRHFSIQDPPTIALEAALAALGTYAFMLLYIQRRTKHLLQRLKYTY